MNATHHSVGRYLVRGFIAVTVIVVVGSVLVYRRYGDDMRAAEARIAEGSKIADTACGAIEYGERGTGIPVLVLHGAGGGYDQGLLVADQLGDHGSARDQVNYAE